MSAGGYSPRGDYQQLQSLLVKLCHLGGQS
jgi:hypothetical protein